MFLAKASKEYEAGVLPDEKMMSQMANYTEELVKAGAFVAADRLEASSKGVRVRYEKGKLAVTDGPFAETKELIAGFCLIEARSKDEAIEWARRIPFQEGEIEVRPLFQLPEFADAAHAVPARKPGTARYLALVKADRSTEAGILPEQKFIADMGEFLKEGAKSGVFLSADGLQPTSKGARVRFSGNKRTIIDGPFAETKELIAGFVVLQHGSKAEAVEWGKRFVQVDAPGRLGGVSECEIRSIFDFNDYGPSAALERFRNMGAEMKK
jgi:hypothetical protein